MYKYTSQLEIFHFAFNILIEMKSLSILMVCLLFVFIQKVRCAVPFHKFKDQAINKEDWTVQLGEGMNPTKTNETVLIRHKRDHCCGLFNAKCCCKVNGQQCICDGYGHMFFKKSHCPHRTVGDWDCKGCKIGYKC